MVGGIIYTERNVHPLSLFLAPSSVHLHYGDVLDSISLIRTLAAIRPHEIYHFAAQSHVGTSYNMPIYSSDVDALGTLRILEAILVLGLHNTTRFYNVTSPCSSICHMWEKVADCMRAGLQFRSLWGHERRPTE
jgi:GDP-D-mannose dehydratase